MSRVDAQPMFRQEYDEELESWLRRRFRYLCITYLVLGVIDLLGITLWDLIDDGWSSRVGIVAAARLAGLGIVGYFLRQRHLERATRSELLHDATRMILALGLLSIITEAGERLTGSKVTPNFLIPLFFWHFSACLFLPWTLRESLKPVIPLMVLWAIGVLIAQLPRDPAGSVLLLVISPAVVIPGLGICAWRLNRHERQFRVAMIGQHFLKMRQELNRARSIHESMFPDSYDDGFVKLDYTYAPMRELGGDFLHLQVSPEGLVHLAVIDVTGHGLPAALTVNRLFGELERIHAEAPARDEVIEPGEVLALLNRYIHLTLARHGVFATGACVTLDPYLGEMRWANAGHPPGFLRRTNGVVTTLDPTAMLLGALPDDQFEQTTNRVALEPGDIVVLYTDGAFEMRDRDKAQFGLENLRRLLARQPAPRNWPQFINFMVNKHSSGRPDDDVLIASLTFVAARETATQSEEMVATT